MYQFLSISPIKINQTCMRIEELWRWRKRRTKTLTFENSKLVYRSHQMDPRPCPLRTRPLICLKEIQVLIPYCCFVRRNNISENLPSSNPQNIKTSLVPQYMLIFNNSLLELWTIVLVTMIPRERWIVGSLVLQLFYGLLFSWITKEHPNLTMLWIIRNKKRAESQRQRN